MRISVRLFAHFRRYLPPNSERATCHIDLPAGATAADALIQLGLPMDRPGTLVILVNGRHSEGEQILQAGDVVAAFPATAGG